MACQILTGCRLSHRHSWGESEKEERFLTPNSSSRLKTAWQQSIKQNISLFNSSCSSEIRTNTNSIWRSCSVMGRIEFFYLLTTCLPLSPKVHSWLLLELWGKCRKQNTINIQVNMLTAHRTHTFYLSLEFLLFLSLTNQFTYFS